MSNNSESMVEVSSLENVEELRNTYNEISKNVNRY